MWAANSSQTQVAVWSSTDSLGITSVAFRYYIYDGSTQKFLQSNGVSFTTSDHSFAGTESAGAWSHTITVPEAAFGYNLYWEATPDVSDLISIGQFHEVATENTLTTPSYGQTSVSVENFDNPSSANLLHLENVVVASDVVSKLESGGMIHFTVDLPNNDPANKQYLFRAKAQDQHRISIADDLQLAWRRTGGTEWYTTSVDTLFEGFAGDTSIDVRIIWGPAGPPIDTFYVFYTEA